MSESGQGGGRFMLGGSFDPLNPNEPVGKVNIYSLPKSYLLAVDDGLVPGARLIRKFGAIKYQTPFDIWKAIATSQQYHTHQTAESLELLSDDNVNDIPGGLGALSVRIFGIKTPTSLAEEFEDVALNGTTPVPLISDWWRIYRMKVRISGTYADHHNASHDSVITLRSVATPTDIYAMISTESNFGLGQSEIGAVTIPAGETAHLIGYTAEVSNTNKVGSIALFIREHAEEQAPGPYTGVMQMKEIRRNIPASGQISSPFGKPLVHVTGPADIGFVCIASAAVEIQVNFIMLVIAN